MKSFFEWFKSSTKVKRWILLILIGISFVCYGFANILVTQEMSMNKLVEIIITFVFGFVLSVIGIVFIQKRNLEIFIEANNVESNNRKNVNIKSLIFNKKIFDEGPRIVVIGGGEGLDTVIRGFKKYTNNITAIVTMEKKKEQKFPFDNVKNSIIAMSDKEELMNNLMNLNFSNTKLKNLNFGDIYLTAMNEIYPNISEAIEKSTEVLNINGKVLPVTLDEITICAELSDGTNVEGKEKIPDIVSKKVEKIKRIYINPSNCSVAPGVIEAIQEAEAIIIGPGSLYTNILPNLLVKKVSKAIKESKAVKVYISNIMTEFGQTDNYSLAEHIKSILDHVGKDVFEYCLTDTGEVMPEFVRKYNKEGSEVVDVNVPDAIALGVKVIERDMSCIKGDKIRHSSDIIAATVIELICNELKFRDMQNGTEYMLLNSRLKQEKKNIKKNQKGRHNKPVPKKAQNTKKKAKQSKFSIKYKDRVESIKNTEKTMMKNRSIVEEKKEKKKAKTKSTK